MILLACHNVMGLVASAGVFALWRLWIYAIAFLLMACVFSSHRQRAGAITDAELTEIRSSGAASLFLCLYAVSRLLIPHPEVGTVHARAALVLGIALCPLWIRRIRTASNAAPDA